MRRIAATIALFLTASMLLSSISLAPASATLPITYYSDIGNTGFYRSSTPFNIVASNYSLVQTSNPDGSVTMTISNTNSTYYDLGFGYTFGTLGSLSSLPITAEGDVSVNLWFDINNDGQFFTWSGNLYTGPGSDAYGLGPGPASSITVDNSSSFYMITPCGGATYTVAQLKSGSCASINSTTVVGIWIGFISTSPSIERAKVTSVDGTTPGAPYAKVTFQTNPTLGTVSIGFSGTNYTSGQSVNLTYGSYSATANVPSGYSFSGWASTGGVSVGSPSSKTTSVTVSGSGTLTLTLTKLQPPPTIIVSSPTATTYTTSSVPLTFTVNQPTTSLAYSLDGAANVTITGSTTLTGLANGLHSVIVYATSAAGTGASHPVLFTVNVPPPGPISTPVFGPLLLSLPLIITAIAIIRRKRPV